ncbi:MAG: ParB N-terminal domain-containing protein [bacterium]|nr:ParB N-terminal domain-containing protein [bacterium]
MFQTVKCAQLDFDDTTFLISYPLEAPSVTASVNTIGVLQPIVIGGCPCQGKYQIVAGFRRAYACREMGLELIHANIYPVDPDAPLPAFDLALYENLAHRTFNSVEKALILSKLSGQFGCSQDTIIQNYMPLLQLAPNERILATYLKLADFEEELKHHLAQHDVPLTVIELLASLSNDDRHSVFSLISHLKLGLNKLKELLNYLEEIALRDALSITEILSAAEIQEIVAHEKYSGPQKIEQLRYALRKQRFPSFTALEEQYHEALKGLKLPRGLQLKTDRFFEDDNMSAGFRFSSPEELKSVAEELLQLSEKAELQELLQLIQGELS